MMLLLAIACSDTGFSSAKGHDGTGGADILVDPLLLDFGAVSADDEMVSTFTITNEGESNSNLTIKGLELEGGAGGFTVLTDLDGLVLPAGASETVEVAFTPMAANAQHGTVTVLSDDEDEARVDVDLVGAGLTPELEIAPDPYDFGTAYIGCTRSHDLTLTNVGTDVLTIDTIDFQSKGMTLTDSNVLPLDLDPGASTTVAVSFTPTAEADYDGLLTVTSNEPKGTRSADVTGVGSYGGDQTDKWTLAAEPEADIIFYVDQSGSMDDDQKSLATNFSKFINQLSVYTSNWHVMVVNDDDGCNNSGVLTSTKADYESKFTSAVSKGGGVWTEAGLTVTSKAVQAWDSGECNDTFDRASAMLHIIMVSDEPEQSSKSWKEYVDAVIAKKGDASLVKFSAIAGPDPGGCHSSGNSAEAGTGYSDAVAATGGEFLSICSDWGTNVKTLADATIVQQTFPLSETPDPATIKVYKNGHELSSYWSYDAANNAIVFGDEHTPQSGDEVEATYSVIASCD